MALGAKPRITDLIDMVVQVSTGVACGRYEAFVAKAILSGDPEGDRLIGDLEPSVQLKFLSNLVQLRVERLVRKALRGTS